MERKIRHSRFSDCRGYMAPKGSLSIFFPCYNDAGTIGTLVAAADSIARELVEDYEIIVVIARNDSLHRTIIGIIYLRLMRLFFNFHIRDVDCDFRLMRRHVFDDITLHHSSGVICLEMIKKMERAGRLFAEFPVYHYHRTYGKSQFFNFSRLFRTLIGIFQLWFELFIHAPKH